MEVLVMGPTLYRSFFYRILLVVWRLIRLSEESENPEEISKS